MRSIDILIVAAPNARNLEERLDYFLKNYDYAEIYTLGSIESGSNAEINAYAFRHNYPLTLGDLEDRDAIYARLLMADHGAVLGFLPEDNDDEVGDECDACLDIAMTFARDKRLQSRFVLA